MWPTPYRRGGGAANCAHGRGESDVGLPAHPRGVGKSGAPHGRYYGAQYPASSPPGACSETPEGWHELATVSKDPLGCPGRHGLFHSGRGDLAWTGDVLYVGLNIAKLSYAATCR